MESKPFSKSLTVRVNSVVAAIGVALLSLPDVLTQILGVLASPDVQQVVVLLPADSKLRHAFDIIVRVLGAALAIIGAVNLALRKRTTGPVAAPKLGRGKFPAAVLVLAMSLGLVGCGTAQRVTLPDVAKCEAVTNVDAANKALGDAQIIRIAARDTVASLYPAVIDEAAVRAFDEKVDAPFTALYRKSRKLIDEGRLDQFKAVCEQVLTLAAKLRDIASGGGAQ